MGVFGDGLVGDEEGSLERLNQARRPTAHNGCCPDRLVQSGPDPGSVRVR